MLEENTTRHISVRICQINHLASASWNCSNDPHCDCGFVPSWKVAHAFFQLLLTAAHWLNLIKCDEDCKNYVDVDNIDHDVNIEQQCRLQELCWCWCWFDVYIDVVNDDEKLWGILATPHRCGLMTQPWQKMMMINDDDIIIRNGENMNFVVQYWNATHWWNLNFC